MRLLHHLARAQADSRPDSAALVDESNVLTYGELENRSNRLARALHMAGCTRGDRVCLLLPKSSDAIVAVHAVLKAGGVYVPLDVASPVARVAKIVEASGPRVIVADASTAGMLTALRSVSGASRAARVGWLEGPTEEHLGGSDFTPADVALLPATPIDVSIGPEAPAHILFTSGSTGDPKGVVITHENVATFLTWAVSYFGLTHEDRNSSHPPLHFDLSTFDIFGTFAVGASLHLVPRHATLMPNKLADFIRDAKLTQWFSVPSLLVYMNRFDVVEPGDFPELKRIVWCGEVFPTRPLMHWMSRLPHVTFTNLYGPTEATIASSYYTVPAIPENSSVEVPIGRACAGEELLILDPQMRPAASGEVGELYIRGAGLSPGYWKDEKRTRAVFLPNPLDDSSPSRIYKTGDLARSDENGMIYFVGRNDSQIKSRGHRIELREVETALYELEAIKECAVVAFETDGFEGTVILCAYVPTASAETSPMQLRAELGESLPIYMLPHVWREYSVLPRNANGKVDRRKLKEKEQDLAAE